MIFPKPCDRCREGNGRYYIGEPSDPKDIWSRKFVKCDCEFVQAMDHYKAHKNDYHAPVISTEHATICAEMMATIPFFPGEAGARIAIADEIAAMCGDENQAVWLARRMIRLYSRWPGLQEMRRVLANNYIPHDGVDALGYSEEFPNGFPKELPKIEAPRIPTSEKRQITQ